MPSADVPVPARLRNPHPAVAATRELAALTRPRADGLIDLQGRSEALRLTVSRNELNRALRIAHALFIAAERSGFAVGPGEREDYVPPGASIYAGGHRYRVSVKEQCRRVPLPEDSRTAASPWHAFGPRTRDIPTGRLRLSLPQGGRRSNWADGEHSRLEDKLSGVLAEIALRVPEDDERKLQREAARQERIRHEKGAEERRLRARLEHQLAERLGQEVAAWNAASDIRRYVMALRATATAHTAGERERIERWCDWAARHADRIDPTTQASLVLGLEPDYAG